MVCDHQTIIIRPRTHQAEVTIQVAEEGEVTTIPTTMVVEVEFVEEVDRNTSTQYYYQ